MYVCMYVCMYVWSPHIYISEYGSTGKVARPIRGQLNRGETYLFPVHVCARELGLVRRGRPSLPASACPFSTVRLNLVLTHEIPPDSTIRHRVSPEFIGSRICVLMAFSAESLLSQGQRSSRQPQWRMLPVKVSPWIN